MKPGCRQSKGLRKRSHIVVCHCSPDTPRCQKHPHCARKHCIASCLLVRLAHLVEVTGHEKDRRNDSGRRRNAVGSRRRFAGSYYFTIKMLHNNAFGCVAIKADLRIFIFMKDTEMLLYGFQIDDRHIRPPQLRQSVRL
ncbi:hypothetical protein AT6N2_C0413 [Agrobacterium tumefaciens]|nr:hypothetical protein AT6N2_C0413 [Agrobacterium tumefaciens]